MLNLEILKLKFNLEVKNIVHVGAHNGKKLKLIINYLKFKFIF